MSTKFGWSKKEYSLNEPVNINGQMYMRKSYGIHDPLFMTVLAIEGDNGFDSAIFCSIDMTVIRGGIITDTISMLKEQRPDIPADYVIMNATHTHSAMDCLTSAEQFPDGSELFNGKKVQPHMVKTAFDAICEAWDSRKEGYMAFGYGYAVVGHSRRSTYGVDMSLKNPNAVAPNGHSVMYGNTNDPDFYGYEAGADHFLNAVYTFDTNEKLTGIIVNIPCPSQLSEHFYQLSADYWCEVREEIAKEFGSNVFVLPQCSAGGDISPRILHYKDAQKRRFALKYGANTNYDGKIVPTEAEYVKVMGERRDIAEHVVESVKEIYDWAKKDIRKDFPVRHMVETLPLKRRMITEEEAVWAKENIKQMESAIPDPKDATPQEVTIAVSRYNAIKGRNERALKRYEVQNENPTIESIVHCVQLGDVAFCTNRFELYIDFMHRMQARSPFIQTFIVQLAGDEGGSYLPTDRAVWGKGYSASLFCNQVGPEAGQQIVEASLNMLNEMKEKDA